MSQVIFRVARLHRSIAGRLLRETGLHPGQEIILMTLWRKGPRRPVDLVEAIASDAPTTARSIARLEEAGLVRRSTSPTDRSAVVVEATAASLALREKVLDAWRELERLTTDLLDDDQRTAVMASLGRREEALGQADGGSA
jgi:MarR family transcriptional regulator, organic hydroperoxide resistance regulator